MLGKGNKNLELETVIGSSVKVKGNFIGQGNVKVEGTISGRLDTKGDVRIGSGAKAQANIKARNVFISGEVKGTIKAVEKTVLNSTARVLGDIETKSLSIESGAMFSGKCLMGDEIDKTEKVEKEKSKKVAKTTKTAESKSKK